TAIGERTPSTKHAEQDARRHARQSKDHADCRAATIRPSLAEIALALSSRCDNHNVAATAKMAILIVAAFSSRLSRYSVPIRPGYERKCAVSYPSPTGRIYLFARPPARGVAYLLDDAALAPGKVAQSRRLSRPTPPQSRGAPKRPIAQRTINRSYSN